MKAGKPSLVIAHGLDQRYWGRKLQQLFVGRKVLHRKTVTTDILAKNLQVVLNTPEMLHNTRMVGQTMVEEDGVGNAVALIDRIF